MSTDQYFSKLIKTDSFRWPLFEVFLPAGNRATETDDTKLIRDVIFVWKFGAVNVSIYGMNRGFAPLPTALTCFGNRTIGSF